MPVSHLMHMLTNVLIRAFVGFCWWWSSKAAAAAAGAAASVTRTTGRSSSPPSGGGGGDGRRTVSAYSGTFVASCPISADDCTNELMAALNMPGVSTVIVPSYPRRVWPVTPLEMANATASNRQVIFQPGLTIEAKRGAFHGGADSLLMCKSLENVTFKGSGATLLMRRSDYANASLYNHSESRMGLQLHGCRNISIYGLNISSTVRDRAALLLLLCTAGTVHGSMN